MKEIKLYADTKEIIRNIFESDLRSVEKVFLALEWIFREKLPIEIEDMNIKVFIEEAKSLLEAKAFLGEYQNALQEVREIFGTDSDSEAFILLMALSYFSYIDDEYVYNRDERKRLLSRTKELCIEPSKVERLYRKWNRITGGSERLFNKIAVMHSK
jgi:hypothetical protein